MKKKVFLTAALLVGMLTGLNAQTGRPVTFRVMGGATYSKVFGFGGEDGKAIPGFRAGVSVDLPFQDVLSIRPTLNFISKGERLKLAIGNADVRPMYVQLPVYLNAYMPYSEKTVWYANLGPYVAYGVMGKYVPGKDVPVTEKEKHDLFKDYKWENKEGESLSKNPMNALDYGLSANLGVEFGRFIMEVGGDLGIADAINEVPIIGWTKTSPKSLNFNGHFSVGVRF